MKIELAIRMGCPLTRGPYGCDRSLGGGCPELITVETDANGAVEQATDGAQQQEPSDTLCGFLASQLDSNEPS